MVVKKVSFLKPCQIEHSQNAFQFNVLFLETTLIMTAGTTF